MSNAFSRSPKNSVDPFTIAAYDFVPTFAVGFLNGLLDLCDRFIARQELLPLLTGRHRPHILREPCGLKLIQVLRYLLRLTVIVRSGRC
jgi:hypothetical protein